MSAPILHCWAEGATYGHPSATCMLPDEHEADHEWTPDRDIIVEFFG